MAQASTLNPEKWLATLRVWVPTEPSENLVAFINSLIEASGPARVNGLDALIAHTEGTTRSGREKFERLRQWSDKMRADPQCWPQQFVRPREVSILIKAILDKAARPLNRFEVEQKFRKFRDVPPSGLSQELKEMAKRGEVDRYAAGLYWRKGTAGKPYELQSKQLYRLAHDAPGHRMPNAELAVTMGISRKDLETLLSLMRKRWRDSAPFQGRDRRWCNRGVGGEPGCARARRANCGWPRWNILQRAERRGARRGRDVHDVASRATAC